MKALREAIHKIPTYKELSNNFRLKFDRWLGGHDDPMEPFHWNLGPRQKFPDYKEFRVELADEMVNLRTRLKHYGLKDPWIRNCVQNDYDTHEHPRINWKTDWAWIISPMFDGWKVGLVMAVCYYFYCKKYYPTYNAHHDHH